MFSYLLVAFGGAIGSVARYGAGDLAVRWFGSSFPWGTLLVNVLGSFIIGFVATLTGEGSRSATAEATRAFLMTGICGGFTTFSAFSLQTLELARGGAWLYAGLNIVGSVVLCLFCVWLGHVLAGALQR